MPLITISRHIGCGGSVIGKLIAGKLNVVLYDDARLQEEALKMGISFEDLKSLDEKAPGFFDRILTRKPELYLDFMEAVIYEVAHRGEGVIIGHGSQMLLRDFGCALHVYLHAAMPSRIKNMMEQKLLTQEAAEKLIRKSDNEQNGFFRYAFNMNWNDPSLYDLIINTEKIGIDSAVGLIMDAAQSNPIQTCSLTAVDAMERLSLVKKIEAALVENNITFSMLNVEVPVKGTARITGLLYEIEHRDRISDVAKSVAGITDVETHVSVMPSGGI
jgi:cytidylate kinase